MASIMLTQPRRAVLDGFKDGRFRVIRWASLDRALRQADNLGHQSPTLAVRGLILKSFPGVSITRVIDRANARIPEHAHDWPVLSLFVIGAYSNSTEIGKLHISGPSAVFYRAGARHGNEVAATGFEQLEIEFDPAWLADNLPTSPVRRWIGGSVAARAQALARLCNGELSEKRLLTELQRFMACAAREADRPPPPWTRLVEQRLRGGAAVSVAALAQEFGRHPSWLGAAYKLATGEGILNTAARLRVERAAHLLRETAVSYAQVAAEAGFCDQSHMNRTFRAVLGRRPPQVRRERQEFRQGLSRSGEPRGPLVPYPQDALQS